MATKKDNVSRRGFLGAIGAVTAAGAAAVTLPLPALAMPTKAARNWQSALTAWPDAVAEMKVQTDAVLARFRPAYFAEVQRFAEELKPQFAAGKLYDYRGDDGGDDHHGRHRLEAICAERFGVEVHRTTDAPYYEGDEVTAEMICAISPAHERWDPEEDWNHPGYCARACIADDVLAIARERGWYVPTEDES